MDIQEIVTTGTRAQELLYSVVKEHADLASKEIETISNFKSIAKLLAHCIGAEERWQARLVHEAPSMRYEADAGADVSILYAHWLTRRERTSQMIAEGGESFVNHLYDVHLAAQDIHIPMTAEQIIYQIISHENYHRAQCSYLLQMFGVDPPNFDFPMMLAR